MGYCWEYKDIDIYFYFICYNIDGILWGDAYASVLVRYMLMKMSRVYVVPYGIF